MVAVVDSPGAPRRMVRPMQSDAASKLARKAFADSLQVPIPITSPHLVDSLSGKGASNLVWPVTFKRLRFRLGRQEVAVKPQESVAGALVYLPAPKRVLFSGFEFLATTLKSGREFIDVYPPGISFEPQTPRQQQVFDMRSLPPYSAFGHLVLLHRDGKNILFLSSMQKALKTRTATRSADRGRVLSADSNQVQGSSRHYSFVDAVLVVAERMIALDVPVEVHVPHSRAIPETGDEGKPVPKSVKDTSKLLESHFKEDSVVVDGLRVPTVNLSIPKTDKARRLLARK